MRAFLLMATAAVTGLCAVALEARTAQPAHYPPFGLDLSARDRATKPGDDFFQFANGRYLARTPIPASEAVVTRRSDMTDRIVARLRTILDEAAAKAESKPADISGKIGAYYASYMDEAGIERRGITAISPELEAIRSAGTRDDLAWLMGRSVTDFYPTPFMMRFDTDLKQTDHYALYLTQSGLGLPDIEYYTASEYSDQREAYRKYAADLLARAGWSQPAERAAAILDIETRIARASWSRVDQRNPAKQYNPATVQSLSAAAPQFAWSRFFAGAGIDGATPLIAAQNTAFPKIAAELAKTPIDDLKGWMAFRVLDDAAPYLPKNFVQARFAFRDRLLGGQSEPAPRWQSAITAVAAGGCSYDFHSCFGTLKWAVGQEYAARYFPAETKSRINDLALNVKAAFRRRLERNDWMDAPTRAEALKKLDSYVIKVGYPDTWQDSSDVVISRDDLIDNVRSAAASDWNFVVRRSKGPVDRSEWLLTPQENNAYLGSLSDIVFPAGILQAPIFDAKADPAVNYGAIGAVIGHELTHGFDDEGRMFDATGTLRDWWTPAAANEFKARTARLGAQYAQYEPLPGLHINPDLTMGENIADLGGLSIALDAYRASLKGRPAPVLGGLTGDQRVFLGWAQAWAGKANDEAIRQLTVSDPHSFRKFRVNGVVRNIDGWYSAFRVKPGNAMYTQPRQRVRIW